MMTWILWDIKKSSKKLREVSKSQPLFRVFLNFALGLLVLNLGSLTPVVKKRRGILTVAFCCQLTLYHFKFPNHVRTGRSCGGPTS